MTDTEQSLSVGTVRRLSESEIQDRLYGSYRVKKRVVPPPVLPALSALVPPKLQRAKTEAEWTGSEILSGELQRLRSELISLRQEKEQLSVRLEKVSRIVPSEKSGLGIGRWIARSVGVLLLIGAVGYLAGGRALQASPAMGDPTPYTLQVAVYNGRQMAEQAERFLKELGYDAFLAEIPRGGSNSRYRIYVGSFVTKEEAGRESQRLAGDTRVQDFKDAFVLVR